MHLFGCGAKILRLRFAPLRMTKREAVKTYVILSEVRQHAVEGSWQSGSREPGRWHLYQIAFALGLKAYLPADIKKNTVLNKTSVNYLFNKVYKKATYA